MNLHQCAQFVFISEVQRWIKESCNGTKTKLQEDQYLIFAWNRNKFTDTGKGTVGKLQILATTVTF
jgi:hypothetical protein